MAARRPSPSSSSRKQPEPDINVTPLVDVMLVLLIIFMVIVPALADGEHIDLPTIANADEKPKELEPFDVALTKSGGVLLDKKPIEPATLHDRLVKMHEAEPKRRIMLKADTALPYAKVRETFALLQDIGFRGIALKVNARDQGGTS